MKKPLESYRGFIVLACLTVIALSIFTYKLTSGLNEKVEKFAPNEAVTELEQHNTTTRP